MFFPEIYLIVAFYLSSIIVHVWLNLNYTIISLIIFANDSSILTIHSRVQDSTFPFHFVWIAPHPTYIQFNPRLPFCPFVQYMSFFYLNHAALQFNQDNLQLRHCFVSARCSSHKKHSNYVCPTFLFFVSSILSYWYKVCAFK